MKKVEKERIAEQEEFEKTYITEALADIRASSEDSTATIETHAKAYIAMLRLKERFGCSSVSFIFTWLRGTNRRNGPRADLKKRYGKEVFSFLKKQPIPIPQMGLDEYQKLWHLYIHPELDETVNREGKFYIDSQSLLITRITNDGSVRTFPNEGSWQLYESYLEALEAKMGLIYEQMGELDAKLEYVQKEIRKEKSDARNSERDE